MDPQDQELEDLHRQASTLYLQGEYGAALQTWRQLLRVDPKDERAREGARLCELLVDDDGAAASGAAQQQVADSAPTAASPAPPAAAAPATPGVGFGMGEDLDESLDELDELLGEGSGSDWMEAPPAAPQTAAAPPEEIELDLSGVSAPEESPPAIPAAAAPTPPAAAQPVDEGFEFNFEGTDQQAAAVTPGDGAGAFDFARAATPGPPPAQEQAAQAAATSAEELQRRTNELMAEAMEHYERGERAEALAALSRLAILDEHDEPARAFADHIRAEIEEAAAASAPAAAPSEAPPSAAPEVAPDPVHELNHEPFDYVPQEDGNSSLALDPAGLSAPGAVAADLPAVDLPEDAAGGEAGASAATPAKTAGEAPRRTGRLSSNQWLMVAAAALLILGGAYAVFQFVGGRTVPMETPLVAPPPLGDPGPPPAVPPVSAQAPAANTDPEGPPAVPVTVPTAEIEALLHRAESEMDSGNYAAAVLTYNEALKLDPTDPAIQSLLLDAGESYQKQKESLEHRRMAIQAFNDGDFRNALRLLYRLEPLDEQDARRFERYKRNGWFNLGLRALKSGDCRMARSHLREAESIDPGDPGVLDALELSAACFESRSQEFFDAVRPLASRSLDD